MLMCVNEHQVTQLEIFGVSVDVEETLQCFNNVHHAYNVSVVPYLQNFAGRVCVCVCVGGGGRGFIL